MSIAALEPSEAAFGVGDPGGAPALDHGAVAPALDPAGGVAGHGDHRLDRVGRGQAAGEPVAHAEPADGEHLLEPFAQRRGGIGMLLFEARRQRPGGPQAGVGVGVVERLRELAVDERPLGLGQVVGDVARLPAIEEWGVVVVARIRWGGGGDCR